jgi:chitinase
MANRLAAGLAAGLIALAAGCGEDQSVERPGDARAIEVIAYQYGDTSNIRQHQLEELTQVIYSFLHLDGNRLTIETDEQAREIQALVALKKDYPHLRILVALGGWGGCETCAQVFSSEHGRDEFAASARQLLQDYDLDGLDLDWEYPAIRGYPGHRYGPEDRDNFTALVASLRTEFGKDYELSFAAGSLPEFFSKSIDWDAVMPLVDRVNLMTYDLVSGNSTTTGHHTPLYANQQQSLSADFGVRTLLKLGVSPQKIVVGAAFYARVWGEVDGDDDNLLYRNATFSDFVGYKNLSDFFGENFEIRWDDNAQAPYAVDVAGRRFATFDDRRSVALKTRYAIDNELGGIMFWQLGEDVPGSGLLDAIVAEKAR